ncbi:MAG: haloacid dehalogenase type II [Pseudomonadota bacterium]|nr:haloacid dehalogenase type II [Pseudomonadota bacterium]
MYKLVAFDAYGTLFDVYSISELAEAIFPGHGQALALMWRDRQIEYTRLVTMSDPRPGGSEYYLPFWDLTIRALRYTCRRLGLTLSPADEARLMAQYGCLAAFPDGLAVLAALKAKGVQTAILSNGNSAMLASSVASSGLGGLLDQIVSVDQVRAFKTAPQTYQLLLDAFTLERSDILFVSSNAWDAVGATWFGLDVFWVNRLRHPFEEIGLPPRYQGASLSALLDIFDDKSNAQGAT